MGFKRWAEVRARYSRPCWCADPAAPYVPCECCGVLVSHRLTDRYRYPVEDDMVRGCSQATDVECLRHAHSWTVHTPKRCREVRQEGER